MSFKVDLKDIVTVAELLNGIFNRPRQINLPPPSAGPLPPSMQVPGDEQIKNPTKTEKPNVLPPVSSRIDVVWMQLSRERFPEAYTTDNPFGFVPDGEKRNILAGNGALNFGSKVRFDTTWKDQNGDEIDRNEVRTLGLADKTRWVVRNVDTGDVSFLQGLGERFVNLKGKEEVKVEEGGNTGAGQGITNYSDTQGFGQVIQFFKEGTFAVHMELPTGQQTSEVIIKVS